MDNDTKQKILDELARLYPDARPALQYKTPYELLVAVILSAQCTDERVNKVTEVLFKEHDTPQKMLALSQEELVLPQQGGTHTFGQPRHSGKVRRGGAERARAA